MKSVAEIENGQRVILRIDSDVPVRDGQILDNWRLKKSLNTIKLLFEKNCKIVAIGHRGRPEKASEEMSLRPVYAELMSLLETNGQDMISSVFLEDFDSKMISTAIENNDLVFMENLRFWPGEQTNEGDFLEPVVTVCSAFVNDAFAVAHRKTASVMLWQKMESFYGLEFMKEMEVLKRIREAPERPVTVILAGAKEDKLDYLEDLSKWADWLMIGGKLVESDKLKVASDKLLVGELSESGLDLDNKTIEKFKEILRQTKTVVWAGALGKFEVEEGKDSTEEIAKLIGTSGAFWLIAGGDTAASILEAGAQDRVDWIASGGGATLEYLTKGKLAAW